jgi:hypothetical protein
VSALSGIGTRTRARALGATVGAVVMLVAIAAYELPRATGGSRARTRAAVPAPLLAPAAFERRSGVRIVRVAASGAGGLVDLRFQVLDPDTAAAIHDAAKPPEIVDERTGVVVNSLLMGHSHTGRFKAARTYYLIFENPGDLVRRGTRVTVRLGPARVAHVPVR